MRDGHTPRGPPSTGRRDGEVYPPREDTFLLLPFARVPARTRVLEVGTGAGRIALEAARCGARVVATDLNRRALEPLRQRAIAEGLDLSVVRADLARGLGRFDLVLSNPPYLPTGPEEHDQDGGTDLALDGGPDGTRVLERLLTELPEHLSPGGGAFVVVSSVQSAASLDRIVTHWERRGGLRTTVTSRTLEGERLEVWQLTMASGAAVSAQR